MPRQYTHFSETVEIEENQLKHSDFDFPFAQDIDCGYTLESRRGGFNEYPQSMFWIKNKKKSLSPYIPVLLYKSRVYGVFIA